MKNSGHHSGLEKHGLDKLLKLLTRVKANGWSDAFTNHRERLDSDNRCVHFHFTHHRLYPIMTRKRRTGLNESGESPFPYSEPLLSLRKSIEESRDYLDALNRVQERLRRRLRTLRKASMPLVLEDGINRLPDELLVYIFEIGRSMNVPGDPSSFSSIHVSHVSLRFRRIALQTPSLWTTIHKVYGECQIREFIARSGGLDLDIKMHELNARISKCHSFLKAMKDTSRRWSSFCLTDMKEAAWYTLEYDLRTYEFPVPKLSYLRVEGYGWLLTAKSSPFLSQLTHVDLRLSEKDEIFRYDAIEGLAQVLHRMQNLKDLSIKMRHCTLKNERMSSLFNKKPYPKPNYLRIDRLAISILGNEPTMVELSIDSITPKTFLFNSQQEFLFPIASTIKLHIPHTIDVMTTLANLLQNREIVKIVHFDTPRATDPFRRRERQLGDDDWERI